MELDTEDNTSQNYQKTEQKIQIFTEFYNSICLQTFFFGNAIYFVGGILLLYSTDSNDMKPDNPGFADFTMCTRIFHHLKDIKCKVWRPEFLVRNVYAYLLLL